MNRHRRVNRLLERLEAGSFDDDDLLEAKMMSEERQWPFPMEDTEPIGYDTARTLRYIHADPEAGGGSTTAASEAPRPAAPMEASSDRGEASLEERVAHLEKMNALVWKVIHQMQGKAPQDPEPR